MVKKVMMVTIILGSFLCGRGLAEVSVTDQNLVGAEINDSSKFTSRDFKADFNTAFDTVLKLLEKRKIFVSKKDRSEGKIVTEYFLSPPIGQCYMNIFFESKGNVTKIRISTWWSHCDDKSGYCADGEAPEEAVKFLNGLSDEFNIQVISNK